MVCRHAPAFCVHRSRMRASGAFPAAQSGWPVMRGRSIVSATSNDISAVFRRSLGWCICADAARELCRGWLRGKCEFINPSKPCIPIVTHQSKPKSRTLERVSVSLDSVRTYARVVSAAEPTGSGVYPPPPNPSLTWLFDLASDPLEQFNLAAARPDMVRTSIAILCVPAARRLKLHGRQVAALLARIEAYNATHVPQQSALFDPNSCPSKFTPPAWDPWLA